MSNDVANRARAYREKRGHWGSHAESLCNEVDRLQAENDAHKQNVGTLTAEREKLQSIIIEYGIANKKAELEALRFFIAGLADQHCAHGGDRNAPAWSCIPCAARKVLE